MTEDNRIPEIQAYHHRVSGLQGEGIGSWCSCSELDCKVLYLLDRLDALEQPTPQVFFPGDTVPVGVSLVTKHGDLLTARATPYRITGGPAAAYIEVPLPSLEDWQAAVDVAKVARGLA